MQICFDVFEIMDNQKCQDSAKVLLGTANKKKFKLAYNILSIRMINLCYPQRIYDMKDHTLNPIRAMLCCSMQVLFEARVLCG